MVGKRKKKSYASDPRVRLQPFNLFDKPLQSDRNQIMSEW